MISPPSVSAVCLAFVGVSFVVLFLITCLKLPEAVRGIRRLALQMLARKTRNERMLADLEKLIYDARQLEGVYRFDTVEPHASPGQAETAAVTASMSSQVAAR